MVEGIYDDPVRLALLVHPSNLQRIKIKSRNIRMKKLNVKSPWKSLILNTAGRIVLTKRNTSTRRSMVATKSTAADTRRSTEGTKSTTTTVTEGTKSTMTTVMEATKSTMITVMEATKSTADKSTVVDMDPTEENSMVVDTDPMVVDTEVNSTVVNSMEVNDTEVNYTEVNNTEVNSTAYTTKDTKNTVKTSTVPALTTSIIQRPTLMFHKPLLNTTTKTS